MTSPGMGKILSKLFHKNKQNFDFENLYYNIHSKLIKMNRYFIALNFMKKENLIIKQMRIAEIENKDIRKLRRKFKDLKNESSEYEKEIKDITKALLSSKEDLSIENLTVPELTQIMKHAKII